MAGTGAGGETTRVPAAALLGDAARSCLQASGDGALPALPRPLPVAARSPLEGTNTILYSFTVH